MASLRISGNTPLPQSLPRHSGGGALTRLRPQVSANTQSTSLPSRPYMAVTFNAELEAALYLPTPQYSN